MERHQYKATAHRDGRWWIFEIPALTAPSPKGVGHRIVAMGQTRQARDVAEAARDVAALWLDIDPGAVDMDIVFDLPSPVEAAWMQAEEKEKAGRRALAEAAALRREAVRELEGAGFSKADVARILGLSRQRVSQLSAG